MMSSEDFPFKLHEFCKTIDNLSRSIIIVIATKINSRQLLNAKGHGWLIRQQKICQRTCALHLFSSYMRKASCRCWWCRTSEGFSNNIELTFINYIENIENNIEKKFKILKEYWNHFYYNIEKHWIVRKYSLKILKYSKIREKRRIVVK